MIKIIITEEQFKNIFKKELILEYSQSVINKLLQKYKNDAEQDIILKVINKFAKIKDNPRIEKKDIMQYSWDELIDVVAKNNSKRVKAGKLNDGEPIDANLIYNKNSLRIYYGKNRNACIKYGNGYSFCISARNEGGSYDEHRIRMNGTPYFIFDDSKTSEKDETGWFIDDEHLLVLFIYKQSSKTPGNNYIIYYSITAANNNYDKQYNNYYQIEKQYPKLTGLQNLFVHIDPEKKEIQKLKIETIYENKLNKLFDKYNFYDSHLPQYMNLSDAIEDIDKFFDPNYILIKLIGLYKGKIDYVDYDKFLHKTQTQIKKYIQKDDIENEIKNFKENKIKKLYKIDNVSDETINKNFDIIVKKMDTSDEDYQNYLKDLKRIVDDYKKEMLMLQLKYDN